MLCIILLLTAKFYLLLFIWQHLFTINKRLTYLLTYNMAASVRTSNSSLFVSNTLQKQSSQMHIPTNVWPSVFRELPESGRRIMVEREWTSARCTSINRSKHWHVMRSTHQRASYLSVGRPILSRAHHFLLQRKSSALITMTWFWQHPIKTVWYPSNAVSGLSFQAWQRTTPILTQKLTPW